MAPISVLQSVPRRKSMSDLDRAAICRHRRRHPNMSVATVMAWAQDELDVTVSRYTVTRVLKKELSRITPMQILINVLDEYTQVMLDPHGHAQPDLHNATDKNTKPMLQPNGAIESATTDNVGNLKEVSPGDVHKYLQAWIDHLRTTDHPDRDHLLCIAEKHLQSLETTLINAKMQTTIQHYFKQTK